MSTPRYQKCSQCGCVHLEINVHSVPWEALEALTHCSRCGASSRDFVLDADFEPAAGTSPPEVAMQLLSKKE